MSALFTPARPIVPTEEPVAGNYFVAAYPPFSAWSPQYISQALNALREPPADAPIGLYLHLPFCQKKCDYCYYLSYPDPTAGIIDRYIDALLREMEWHARQEAVRGRRVSFVYFGGGTPSMLSGRQAEKLLAGLQAIFPWQNVREVTFECAPRSTRPGLLEVLRARGVTRLSMGVQSLDNRVLKLNGRVHLAEDAVRAYGWIRQADFDWVNLDLMAGLIGETPESWRESVHRVIQLRPQSVTLYQTEMPFNTQLYRDWKAGRLPSLLPTWTAKRERVLRGFDALREAGYSVVSAYSAVQDPARHRFLYQHYLWSGHDMLGLGAASFSYCNGVHFQNEAALPKYFEALDRGALPIARAFPLGARDRLIREFILQLKWGEVSALEFERKFGVNCSEIFAAPLSELEQEGLLRFGPRGVELTANGLAKADRIAPRFYDAHYRAARYW